MENITVFTSDEKIAFLAALNFASKLNGVTTYEQDFIRNLAEVFKISDEELAKAEEILSKEQVMAAVSVFTDRHHKLELVKELFFLGYSDGNLSDEELMFLASVGNKLGLDDDIMEDISRWVIAGIEWQEEGERIFGSVEHET